MEIKRETAAWHTTAKKYWQQIYVQNYIYLDHDFVARFPLEFHSLLWELTLIAYIKTQLHETDTLLKHKSKNKRFTDFCFEINGQKFYLEGIAPEAGSANELNTTFKDINEIIRPIPIMQYKQRLCSAIRLKGNTYYLGDAKNPGYKAAIGENAGFIIAISMSKIPLFNQPRDYLVDLSCILGLSARKIPIIQSQNGQYQMGSIYHDEELFFQKSNSNASAPIDTNYFVDSTYSYISAILISYSDWVFYPNADQYGVPIHWDKCRNDYILIHNPFATIPLPIAYLSVYREITPKEVLSLQNSSKYINAVQE